MTYYIIVMRYTELKHTGIKGEYQAITITLSHIHIYIFFCIYTGIVNYVKALQAARAKCKLREDVCILQ